MTPRRGELLGALSLAIDLGLGQPAEHVLRSALTADRLARRLGCDDAERLTAFYVTLVMWIGCHADSHEYSRWFGDDIAARRDSYLVDWAGLPYARYLARHIGRGEALPERMRLAGVLLRNPRGNLTRLADSHCASAGALARRIGLGEAVAEALAYTYERWDGSGVPHGAAGAALPLAIRIAHVADIAEVRRHLMGVDAAIDVVRTRAGRQFDPDIVHAFAAAPREVLVGPGTDAWAEALRRAPDRTLTGPELDGLVTALGDFVDLKSPFTLGHSSGVAELAAAGARHAGMGSTDVDWVRRAGHLHDLGRIGVSNLVWDKAQPLTRSEVERVRMHPYLTGRILHHVGGLEAESELAANHHERLDGSGYPRGLAGGRLSLADQILAAADTFHTALEPRPHRPTADRSRAAAQLRAEVGAGRLSGDAVAAVLAAAGHGQPARGAWPDGLTNREVEVLRLVARAWTTTQIAAELGISGKTVRNHVEHVFAKTATTNRVGASLYAMEHGLASVQLAPSTDPQG